MIAFYKKYKNISKEILDEYQLADTHFFINDNDKNLIPIRIDLPEMPLPETIDGFGLKAKDQKFKTQKYPQRLKKLEKECGGNIDEIWIKLNRYQNSYKDEIQWIKKQWYHRLFGYWFFNHGKPTYIDGWHFMYLNYFHLDVGLPKYRDRDRRWILVQRFAYNDTKDFINKSKEKADNNLAIPENDGTYLMKDLGRRVCYGTIDLKGRRFGDSYKGESIGLEIVTRSETSVYGIQGMDGKTGKQSFDKVVHAWRKYPFFFQPKFDNSTNPKEEISFFEPSIRGAGSNAVGIEAGLESTINFASTADRGFYDGTKLLFYLSEEDGKVELEDVLIRNQVVIQCLSLGKVINGFTIHPTTVGEMADKAIKRFKELCDQSNYYQRNDNGQTMSGLYVVFFPSYDGLEGFIDEYGMSVIDTPTAEQALYINSEVGSKQYLQNTLDALLKKGDENALRTYRERKRLFPVEYADCFMTESGDIGMPYEKIDSRLSELNFGKPLTRRGNFVRIDKNDIDSYVVWEDDDVNGRWEVSRLLPDNESNQRYFKSGQWFPTHPDRFISSQDPFRLSNVQHSRMSDGGGCQFMLRDKSIDPDSKDIELWITHDLIATYKYRPTTTDEYAEDMLTANVYYGSLAYPEVNLPLIIEYFTKRKHAGYLKYGIDKATGKYRKTAGFSSLGDSKADLFNAIVDYLQKHCHRVKHKDFLLEAKKIKGLDDMKNYDLFTAVGGALLGVQQVIYKNSIKENTDDLIDLNSFFPSRIIR